MEDANAEANVRNQAAIEAGRVGFDDASAYVDQGGVRYRIPKGSELFDVQSASGMVRNEREVVTERHLMNIHGTIFEVPLEFAGGGVSRMRPITTHNLDIHDFMSWRGMLVLSGNRLDASEDGHYVQTDDGKAGLWFGNVDDLWSFGAPRGEGGPWKDTAVVANETSDPYLMTGYSQKELQLSHTSSNDVEFTIEIDFLGTGAWETYDTLTVGSGETLSYVFEDGYSAHWLRLHADTNTTATAWLIYDNQTSTELAGDFDLDGDVDGIDFLTWQRGYGTSFDSSDLEDWVANYGLVQPGTQNAAAQVPEPGGIASILVGLSSAVAILHRTARDDNR